TEAHHRCRADLAASAQEGSRGLNGPPGPPPWADTGTPQTPRTPPARRLPSLGLCPMGRPPLSPLGERRQRSDLPLSEGQGSPTYRYRVETFLCWLSNPCSAAHAGNLRGSVRG